MDSEQPWHSQRRVRPERQWVEEVVIESPVQDVNAPRTAGRAHVEHIIEHEEVLPFDELDAHLLGEESVLEVSAVVHPRGEQHDGGVRDAARRDALEVLEEHVRILLDRRHGVMRKQLGKQSHHHLPILEHVGNARRCAQIVFEHAEVAPGVTHDVDPGDVGVDLAGDVHTLHLRPVLRVAKHSLGRDHPCPQNMLLVVDVADKGVQRAHALRESCLESRPSLPRE